MLLMIDNYDSFTYNLVQYFGELGQSVTVHRNDEITVDEIEALNPKHIVISPGPCTPNEAGISLELIEKLAGKVPILGVCLGFQAIVQAFGGNIIGAKRIMHGKVSQVEHDGKKIFKGVSQNCTATRYHSLVLAPDSIPEVLEITARSEDVIMGVRHKEYPIEGIQFHPESILTIEGPKMITNWLTQS